MNTILTQSGNYFDFDNPEDSTFNIEDVAHSLSLQCRFTGHVPFHFSVAQHSLNCAVAALHSVVHNYPDLDIPLYKMDVNHKQFIRDALMHDAAEAFIGDVAKPLKNMLPDYQALEHSIEKAVFARFNVTFPVPAEVKLIDNRMLVTEQKLLLRNNDNWKVSDQEPYTEEQVNFNEVDPEETCKFFIETYDQLK